MRKSTSIFFAICFTCILVLGFSRYEASAEEGKPCPWRISKIQVSKWANGNHKSSIWVSGSFPIPPGVPERPTWFINGNNVGHSQTLFGQRVIPHSSHLLSPGQNSITVRFLKPPYNGASFTKTISNFSWDKVGPGQDKSFK